MSGNSVQNKYIHIKGARVHNLKNIEVKIPRNKLIVITGVSGSGKSSLAFDTLYAEGQRRYVESLSSYARQFLGRIDKPEVDFIRGIPPAIAIEQKVNTRNPRSTVGTSTEIYDFLKLLYARIGKTYSPVTGNLVTKHDVSDVVEYLLSFPESTRALIECPINFPKSRGIKESLALIAQQGFNRVDCNDEINKISDVIENENFQTENCQINLVLDRISIHSDDDTQSRMADSIQSAFNEGAGNCTIKIIEKEGIVSEDFSHLFELDGISFNEPTPDMFSFNNPIGACPKCEGYGKVIGIDEDLVIPNKSLSVYNDAVVCWKGEKMSEWKKALIAVSEKIGFPIHKPYYQLTDDQKSLLWNGNQHFEGIHQFFKYVEEKSYKIQYRVMLARYRGKTTCPDCKGTRLKKEVDYVKINDTSIKELVTLPISKLKAYFDDLSLNDHDQKIASRILKEINHRLEYLVNVGLGYLSINRLSSTLSGGESQRINIATSLGSGLVGSLYILDEPSIGLHSRDTENLLTVIRQLQKLNNTVVVVEHDEDIMLEADQIIDIGPNAGTNGGEVIFSGTHDELKKHTVGLTCEYLTGKRAIAVPAKRRKWNNLIQISGARENNLKDINVKIPLNVISVISGVSGSGKSTLVKQILYPALMQKMGGFGEKPGQHDSISGDINRIKSVEFVDQNPIGKSSRSNPVTYLKAYDEIRKLYSDQQGAKQLGLKPSHFSFNVDGGRCEECQGEGVIKVEMQFMADIYLTCENCKGQRFKEDILEIRYREKNINDLLQMTINQAIDFFNEKPDTITKKIIKKLKPLQDVGLGYVQLGQSSNTLSGGESQRVKLASFLSKEKDEPTFFIFDEPTTGLHFHDINKLLDSFNALITRGHSILIIEHNLEIIKNADWLIDLGPEGGDLGGYLIGEGTPEEIVSNKKSFTGKYLKEKLKKQ